MARPIMIQGTASGVGKSLLVAGLCRVLVRRGYRTAPFKSQNRAFNSFVTAEGHEISRAQAMQAEAAMISPSVFMNPILLKPQNDTECQVMVGGEVFGTMSAKEYYDYRKKLLPIIKAAYSVLAEDYDVIIVEGAGSPAEINQKTDDILNMGIAKLIDSPVLLVGDIDRGGVFASLYGTSELLDRMDRSRVKGFIINKFRGDRAVLDPGLGMLEEKTRIPTLGVVPWLEIDLEDEDNLSPRLTQKRKPDLLTIAVIRFPQISSFTDFHVLEQIAGVTLQYVTSPEELNRPDLIILPGTKNTMGDLAWLRKTGFEPAITALARALTPVVGICGGYQMLGRSIADPEGVEGHGTVEGLGLLPVHTIFTPEKQLIHVTGQVNAMSGVFSQLSGKRVEGYKIHMGATTVEDVPIFSTLDGHPDGAVAGHVLGSYLHGLFDSTEFTEALLGILLSRKGLPVDALQAMDYQKYKEQQYEALADALEWYLDMERILLLLEGGFPR